MALMDNDWNRRMHASTRKLKDQLKKFYPGKKFDFKNYERKLVLSQNEKCPIKKGDWTYKKSIKIIRIICSEPQPVVQTMWHIANRIKRRAWRFDFYLLRDKKVVLKKNVVFYHEDLLEFKIMDTNAEEKYQVVEGRE